MGVARRTKGLAASASSLQRQALRQGAADLEAASTQIEWEHVFAVSIKGRPHTWLLAAIRRGDLAGVRAAAAELGHEVNLTDALSIVLVMANHGDHRYDALPRSGSSA